MSIQHLYDVTSDAEDPQNLYLRISWPDAPLDRPYVYINMASTLDGKIVLGSATGTAMGVGGPTDQLLFRRLQGLCDGVLVGGVTLRAGQVIYAPELPRFTLSRSGNLPLGNRFFTDAPGKAWVFVPENLPQPEALRIESVAHVVRMGTDDVDLTAALRYMRHQLSIETLLCEGGPTVNDQLLRDSLVDELFLTLAPRIKGGANLPTIVTGVGFPPGQSCSAELISIYHDSGEIYLRYRVNPKQART